MLGCRILPNSVRAIRETHCEERIGVRVKGVQGIQMSEDFTREVLESLGF